LFCGKPGKTAPVREYVDNLRRSFHKPPGKQLLSQRRVGGVSTFPEPLLPLLLILKK
jgi:hypothetical protein